MLKLSTHSLALLAATILLSVAMGAALGHSRAVTNEIAPSPPLKISPTTRVRASSLLLEELRQDSALGNEAATRDLAAVLLDRYDMEGDEEDLFEAIIWIDRNLYAAQNVDLAKRVSQSYCDHHVLRWHAICALGG